MNNKLNQSHFKGLWGLQLSLSLFFALTAALTLDWNAGISALFGGLVYIIPNMLFAKKFFKHRGAAAAKQIVTNFYQGEALKIITSVFLFAVVFAVWSIKPLIFFVSYILVQMTHWAAPWIILRNRIIRNTT